MDPKGSAAKTQLEIHSSGATHTSQEVFRLSDIHPESGQIERMELLSGSDFREDFLFNRSWTKLLAGVNVSTFERTIFAHGDGHDQGQGQVIRDRHTTL